MKQLFFPLFAAFLMACGSTSTSEESTGFIYPETRKSDHVDHYHGTEVADPYQWMEDDFAEEVTSWVNAQNALTNSYLDTIPQREKINARLTEIWSFAKMGAPYKKGNYYFYSKNNGTQNHSVVYKANQLGEEGTAFLDPNTFSEDGTTALTSLSFSKDGKWAAYAISKAGSDWREIHVKNVATGEVMDDLIEWVKFSGISWKGNGFFYSRYDAPKEGEEYSGKNEFHKVYYHTLGTTQSEDVLIYEDTEHPLRNFGISLTDDEQYFVLSGTESTSGNSLYIAYAKAWQPGKEISFTPVIEGFEQDYWVIDNTDKGLLVFTNDGAPKNRVALMNPTDPAKENWTTLVAEKEHVLESISMANGHLVAKYLEDVSSKMYVLNMDGETVQEIPLPGSGYGIAESITSEKDDSLLFFSYVTYTAPHSIYQYNLNTNATELYFKPDIDFDSEALETKQIFFKSKDGTTIPMFITHKKGLQYDGNTPTFLFGYGGFNISYTPEFRVDRTVFLENGGIYAVANIRGGGEYGEAWHKAGIQLNKQNVFDDFIAAAEYLIEEGYTNKEKLAVHGRSNGGLLIGAIMTQRPDLFKVAIPKVGVLDMLKYHKFTIGWAWVTDYGSSDDEEQFNNLIQYSPVHNVKEGTEYPATLVVTGDHDDRVVPAHSFKFIAELQAKQAGNNPVLIRIDTDGGHGSGKPVDMQIKEFADTWAFVFHHLGMEMP